MKKTLGVSFVLALLCGVTFSAVASGHAEKASSSAKQVITYWAFGSPNAVMSSSGESWDNFYKTVFADYMAKHPDVTVKYAVRGYEAGGTTLFMDAAIAAGNQPDIYFDTKLRIQKYYSQGLTADVSGALTSADRSQYPADFLKGFETPQGGLWGIPVDGGYWDVAINKTLFEKRGLTDLLPKPPDYTWTTTQFLAAARAINDPPNVYATGFYAKTPSSDAMFNAYFGGFPGVHWFDPSSKKFTINSPQAIKALEFFHSLQTQNLIVPGPAGLDDNALDPYWLHQKVAIMAGANWYVYEALRAFKTQGLPQFQIMLANYPNEPGAPPAPLAQNDPDAFIAFKQNNAQKMTDMVALIHYLQLPQTAGQIADGWSKEPLRYDAQSATSADKYTQQWDEFAKKFGSRNFYFDSGEYPHYNSVREAWAEARQKFWQKDANIQAVMNEFVKRADQIISR